MGVRIGIDNGAEGAIVAIDQHLKIVRQCLMPSKNVGVRRKRKNKETGKMEGYQGKKRVLDMAEIYRTLDEMNRISSDIYAVLEYASTYPGEGLGTAFNAGRGYGAVEMALVALKIPYQITHPRTWQKILKKTEGKDTKDKSIRRCQREFPDLNLQPGLKRTDHDGLADAANMAHYALLERPFAPFQLAGGDRSRAPRP